MQYRQFSTPSTAKWYPVPPQIEPSNEEEVEAHCVAPPPIVNRNSLHTESGRADFHEALGIPEKPTQNVVDLFDESNKGLRETAEALHFMMPLFQNIEENSLVHQNARCNDEADGAPTQPRYGSS